MLMAVKNQIKVTLVSVKYALMREMLNKWTFLMNVFFMILNNASFILQWIVIYSLKQDIGGYTFEQVLLLWAFTASTFGISHFFFRKAYSLSDTITYGKLDSYLVQPKNILISAITSEVDASAIGDMLYALIIVLISKLTMWQVLLFMILSICGGVILTALAVILASLSFWLNKSDMIADTGNNMTTHFATYPEGIFNGIVKFLLYTIIPVGFTNYIPVSVMTNFDWKLTLMVIGATAFWVAAAFAIFYKGLRRYSSSNLMIAKI
ncbi:MAG: ABC-2 family transporter protein [Clostridia bacterium]|nr:ABC-2 family transporter protein [Clostridia bacterium]